MPANGLFLREGSSGAPSCWEFSEKLHGASETAHRWGRLNAMCPLPSPTAQVVPGGSNCSQFPSPPARSPASPHGTGRHSGRGGIGQSGETEAGSDRFSLCSLSTASPVPGSCTRSRLLLASLSLLLPSNFSSAACPVTPSVLISHCPCLFGVPLMSKAPPVVTALLCSRPPSRDFDPCPRWLTQQRAF